MFPNVQNFALFLKKKAIMHTFLFFYFERGAFNQEKYMLVETIFKDTPNRDFP